MAASSDASINSQNAFFDQALEKLRDQVWIGTLIFVFFALVFARLARFNAGVESTPMALTIQIVMYAVIIVSLLLRHSRYGQWTRTAFLLIASIVMPLVMVFYGGVQGFGDLAFYCLIILSILFGWHRWMYLTCGLSVIALIYVYYLEIIGQPVVPFLDDATQWSSLKTLMSTFFVGFTIYFGNRFYRQLLERHRLFVEEQLRLTDELRASDNSLRELTDDLAVSNQEIVTAQETERLKLRGNLYEKLGPDLQHLVSTVNSASGLLSSRPTQADAMLSEVEKGIEDVLVDVRAFVYELRPPMLDQLGLSGAMREYARKLDLPLEIKFDIPEKMTLGAATEVVCFKVFHTVLDSLKSRTKVTLCNISVEVDQEMLSLLIDVDDAQGFNQLSESVVFKPVSEEIDELTGQFLLNPQPSKGSWLRIDLPNTIMIEAY